MASGDVEEDAAALLMQAEIMGPLVLMQPVLDHLGIELDLSFSLPRTVRALLYYGPRRPVLSVNQRLPCEERRMAGATLIGRFLYEKQPDSMVTNDCDLSEDAEWQGQSKEEKFAAVFLLPRCWLRQEWRKGATIDDLVETFAVPRCVVRTRLAETGLLTPALSA